MNERMKTLCQNAFEEVHKSRVGTDGLIRTDGNPYIFYEKFAELIVQECLSQVDKMEAVLEDDKEKTGVAWVGLAIAKHFGVE